LHIGYRVAASYGTIAWLDLALYESSSFSPRSKCPAPTEPYTTFYASLSTPSHHYFDRLLHWLWEYDSYTTGLDLLFERSGHNSSLGCVSPCSNVRCSLRWHRCHHCCGLWRLESEGGNIVLTSCSSCEIARSPRKIRFILVCWWSLIFDLPMPLNSVHLSSALHLFITPRAILLVNLTERLHRRHILS
jgi:hypothetical protein